MTPPRKGERDQKIVHDRHMGESYKMIGSRYGISRERVGQIIRREERRKEEEIRRKNTQDFLTTKIVSGNEVRIEDCDLLYSNDVGRKMRRVGIHTLGDICKKTEKELTNFKGCGAKTVERLKEMVSLYGMRLSE